MSEQSAENDVPPASLHQWRVDAARMGEDEWEMNYHSLVVVRALLREIDRLADSLADGMFVRLPRRASSLVSRLPLPPPRPAARWR